MGANQSNPLVPPPLSDATDDSDDELLSSEEILTKLVEKGGGEDDDSIVFFDDDEEDEEDDANTDLYRDDDLDESGADEYLCFGVPFLGLITSQLSMNKNKSISSVTNNDPDEDEDPTADIESLQLELKVVDAIYQHHNKSHRTETKTQQQKMESVWEQKESEEEKEEVVEAEQEEEEQDEDDDEEEDLDEDPQENVESLRRELEKAEENYVAPEASDDAWSKSSRGSKTTSSSRSSSFIDLQQLLFSSPNQNDGYGGDEDSAKNSCTSLFSSSSSTKTCRIVEIYETRSTQLRPRPGHEQERVPLERSGIPFRKCRNPSCSCHRSTRGSSAYHHIGSSSHPLQSSRRHRNRGILDVHNNSSNDKSGSSSRERNRDSGDEEDSLHSTSSSSFETRKLKRRSALHRLQTQREKLLAMDDLDDLDYDEDDLTEATAGSSSSSSKYSGYSIRSDCQINARKQQHYNNHNALQCNFYPNNSNGQPRHVDCSIRGGRSHRRQRSLSEDCKATGKRDDIVSPTFIGSQQLQLRKQQQQPPSPPPLPSRQSFGGSSTDNNRHITFPTTKAQLQSRSRNINSASAGELSTNSIPRRSRSEDFIDGNNGSFRSNSWIGSVYTSKTGGNGIKNSSKPKDSVNTHASAVAKSEGQNQPSLLLEAAVQRKESLETNRGDKANHSERVEKVSRTERSVLARNNAAPTICHGIVAAAVAVPNREEERMETAGKDIPFVCSPNSIMEEVHHHHSDSYQRSRTTQHQSQHGLRRGSLQQHSQQERRGRNKNSKSSPIATSESDPRGTPFNREKRDDHPARSRLFHDRENNLKECRRNIKLLQTQGKLDRRRKLGVPTHPLAAKDLQRHQHQQHQREFRRAMQLGGLYHNMGLIHYQQGRYDTARHVLQCGVDSLVSHRASFPPFAAAALVEATDPFDDDYSAVANVIDPAGISPSHPNISLLPTLDEAAPYLSNQALLLVAELVLAQGTIYAAQGLWRETKESSGRVLQWSMFQKQRLLGHPTTTISDANSNHNRYWKEWGPKTARAQVLFARCFERELRYDISMGHYQEALSVQKCVLAPNEMFQAADTLYRMGNLHAACGMLGLAGNCYDEALCLYKDCRRYQQQLHQQKTGMGLPYMLEQYQQHACSQDSLSADEATVLAGLGWIFWAQRDLERALVLTNEALETMIHVLGESHRNVLSLKHQLACIRNSYAAMVAATAAHTVKVTNANTRHHRRLVYQQQLPRNDYRVNGP